MELSNHFIETHSDKMIQDIICISLFDNLVKNNINYNNAKKIFSLVLHDEQPLRVDARFKSHSLKESDIISHIDLLEGLKSYYYSFSNNENDVIRAYTELQYDHVSKRLEAYKEALPMSIPTLTRQIACER